MSLKPVLFSLLIVNISLFFTACDDNNSQLSAKDHLQLAQLYFKQGSIKASLIESKNALQLQPNNAAILDTTARILIELGDYHNATNLIKKAISIEKNNQDLKLLLSRAHTLNGKILSAKKIFSDISETSINDKNEYLRTKADLSLASNNATEAKGLYLSAYEENPMDIDAIIGIAKSSLFLKQMADVKKYSEIAIESAPKNTKALLWQAQIHMLQKNYSSAETILSRAIVEFEKLDTLTLDKYTAINMLAKSLVAQGRISESFSYSNYLAKTRIGKVENSYEKAVKLFTNNADMEEAEKAFQDVLNQAPSHKPSGIILGLINYNQGDYSKADEYLSRFSSEENSPLRSKKVLALTKIKLNKIEDAIMLITESLSLHASDSDLHALLGLAYLRSNKIDKSIISLEKAIQLSTDNANYYTQLSRAYLLKNNASHSISLAKKAIELSPETEAPKLALISAFISGKKYISAKTAVNKWLNRSPDNLKALNILAAIELESGNTDQAKKIFSEILQKQPDNISANLNMIRFDLKDKNITKAMEKLSAVLSTQPSNSKALSLVLRLANNPINAKNSLDTLTSIVKKHPNEITAHLALAQLNLNLKKHERALVNIEEITKIDNKNIQAYSLKAKAYLALNDIQKAKNTYKLISSLSPDRAFGHAELAKILLYEKNIIDAIKVANKAVSIEPDSVNAHLILASAHIKANNKENAINSIDFIKSKMPDSSIPYELMAEYYLNNNNLKQASKQLDLAWSNHHSIKLANKIMLVNNKAGTSHRALFAWEELTAKHPSNAQLHISYALALYSQQRTKAAIAALDKVLVKYPENVIALNNLANIYLEQNDKRALPLAQKALAYSPENPAVQDTVGWIYVKQYKNYEKGIPLIRRAYESTLNQQIKQHLEQALNESNSTQNQPYN